MSRLTGGVVLGVLFLSQASVFAEGERTYGIVIKDHHFEPAELRVPVGEKIRLVIDNQDRTPEEFESHDLKREKVIPGNSRGAVMVGPLEAGTYHFVGEFHEDMAKGVIVAEQKEE